LSNLVRGAAHVPASSDLLPFKGRIEVGMVLPVPVPVLILMLRFGWPH
jgi:hypothetical protein